MDPNTRRLTKSHGEGLNQFKFELPLADTVQVKAGSLVMMNSSGEALPADTTGGTVIGRADAQVGEDGVSLDPVPTVRVTTGVFSWDVASSSLDNTKIGVVAYVVDDHTVGATGTPGTTVAAGIFLGLDDDGQAKVATSPLITGALFAAFDND